ncbi:unnamed protein product [Sphenostylis stenocarpa]|uniref:glutathione-specific gamma-glutamylcyclotransferase n=1 Tax=Sphenostylis stenocarpa TaxID=92480 RepID=A0AA86TGV4_9FABA|nr:unnamed protein product [Sphenostylis stenocarpa]
MKPSTELNSAIIIDVDSSSRSPSILENHPNQQKLKHLNVPLLLQQPSYATHEFGNIHTSLQCCALDHSSLLTKLFSYFAFIFLTFTVPLFTSLFVHIPASQLDPFSFNKLLQLPQSALAIVAFFTLSPFFPSYGLRQLLFPDVLQDDSFYVRRGVEISVPCGTLLNWVVFVLVLLSWVYRTGLFLLACVLFRLTCELQILRFEGLHKLFEGCESDANTIFREHVRIKRQLWITSHRYRFFIISCLVTITVGQLTSLLLVLESKSDTTFFNSGDLVICSAVQLCGFALCLMGAARITHRAQGIVSIAAKWHMVATNASTESEQWKGQMAEGLHSPTASDSDSSEIQISVTPSPSFFHNRQALVTYLEHNYGGITLFGFVLDRGLIHTLFAFEFSMVLWILKIMVFWVFGYGSLVWNPGFDYDEKIIGFIKDYRRVFDLACIDHRGTPENPARTCTLEEKEGSICWGAAYCVRGGPEKEKLAMQYLERRECEYDRKTLVTFFKEGDSQHPALTDVIVFTSTPDKVNNKYYLGPAPLEDMARQIATAYGPCGNNRDYLFLLEKAMYDIGHEDDLVIELANEVRKVLGIGNVLPNVVAAQLPHPPHVSIPTRQLQPLPEPIALDGSVLRGWR